MKSPILRLIKIISTFAYFGVFPRSAKLFFLTLPCSLVALFFSALRGSNLTKALELLGPVYIKLGQSLSLKPYIVGQELAQKLSKLRGDVKSSNIDLKKIVKEELGQEYEDIFQGNIKLISSASIANVYGVKCKKYNSDLALKVIKPEAKELIEVDFKIFKFVIKVYKKISKIIKKEITTNVEVIIEDLHENIQKEINLNNEIQNTRKLKTMMLYEDGINLPEIRQDLSSESIMTMNYIDGYSISSEKFKSLPEKKKLNILKLLVKAFFKQVYEHGFFHCDIHPGNFLIKDDEIYLIDCGACSSLSEKNRTDLILILKHLMMENFKELADVYLQSNFLSKEVDRDFFTREVGKIGVNFIKQKDKSIASFFQELLQLWAKMKQEIPREILMFQKTALYIESVAKEIEKDADLWEIVLPLL